MTYVPKMGKTESGHLFSPRSVDPNSRDYDEFVRAVEEAYPWPSDGDRRAFEDQFDRYLSIGRDNTIKRALESFDPDEFTTFMTQIVHMQILDGFGQPGFRNWEPIVDQVSFSDFEDNEAIRFENPSDLVARKWHEEGPSFEELDEKTMPTWRGSIYQRGFGINFETTTIRDLERIIQNKFGDGVAVNRTIEKFVFVTLIEDNPSITVDGSSQSLFADSHTGGTDNDLNGSTTVLDADQLEQAVTLLADQTLDGEALDLMPRFIIVKQGSPNHFEALRILGSNQRPEDSDRSTGLGSNAANVFNQFGLQLVTTPVLDPDSWFVMADPASAPDAGVELGFLNGQDAPEMVDVDEQQSTYFKLTGINRWLLRIAFGGTPRTFHGIVRGSPAS